MNKKIKLLFCLAFSLLISMPAMAQLQSPNQFLGYELGDRWTQHHNVLNYVNHVAEESEYVTIHHYGTTNQHRDLVYLIVTSPENHDQIEEIRMNNLRLTGLAEGTPTANQKGIVWLSYNIHGNETSSSEASMKTLYELVRPDNAESKLWLDNTVVIMDPMINPDGRERYVTWFQQMQGAEINPKIEAREHHEPWPGGRSNHYMFDLNRDWAWQVQKESQLRYEIYKQWFPHIHVDYHEQGFNAPYYFAPAAEPFHHAITDWQREFQTMIGKNHIRYFDEESWLFFTRERFDLFYPSFGDTWPTFHGAIGMTYEMPGHSLSGLGIERAEGDTLTLAHRVLQHHTTGMSTVEIASMHSDRMISEFRSFFENSTSNPTGKYKTFVVKADNHPDKIYNLLKTLDNQQISYGTAGSGRNVNGFDFSSGETGRVAIQADDIIISTYQPQGNLVRVFFEPNPEISDSLTYDLTAWEAHYRFGLDGYALEARIDPNQTISSGTFRETVFTGTTNPYAYLLRWNSMDDARFLADIAQNGIISRFSQVPFQVDGETFDRGTLMIPRENNQRMGQEFDRIILDAAEKHHRSLHGATTGFVTSGSDFGSSNLSVITAPKVAVLMGDGTASLNAGEIWHFFDHQLNYPATLIHTNQLMRVDLKPYDVLVLPSGSYSGILTDTGVEKLSAWTRDGGTLIAFGQANSILAGRDGFQLQRKFRSNDEPTIEDKLLPYGERDRRSISSRVFGSIFKVSVDSTHPLAYGYDSLYHTLKTDASAFEYLDSGWNVGTVQTDAHLSGFAGYQALEQLEHSLSFGSQRHGSGNVVYFVDNPLFRGFWENGKLMMANAIFFVGND